MGATIGGAGLSRKRHRLNHGLPRASQKVVRSFSATRQRRALGQGRGVAAQTGLLRSCRPQGAGQVSSVLS